MKLIETAYAGYKFRSRLEARWAVFFDEMGITWEYETEGYEINGAYYLPDFYLPEHDCWIEIKGEDPVVGASYNKDYRDKRLLEFSYEKLLVVFWGVPGENDGHCFCHDSTDSSAGDVLWCEMEWCESSGKPAIISWCKPTIPPWSGKAGGRHQRRLRAVGRRSRERHGVRLTLHP